jgi:TrmH family RNA methyltransferase
MINKDAPRPMERITSRTNPLCTRVRKLAASASYRYQRNQFLCDSPKLLVEALLWRPELLDTVICAEGTALPMLPAAIRAVEVPQDLMESISPTKTPQGILSICTIPEENLPERLTGRHYIVLDGVQDPGNVGTILRTADALFTDGVILVNACADLYSPKTVRATMGAIFRCPAWSCTTQQLQTLLTQSELPMYGASLRSNTVDARTVDYRRAAVAIGSEGRGLSEEMLFLCRGTIRIPMQEHCESLNAAAAAAVLLWEMARGDAHS